MAGSNGNDPMKVISIAFKEIDREEYNELLRKFNDDVEHPDFRTYIE